MLYGSQSGNAENLTKQLKEDLERRGIECEMETLNDVDVNDLKDKEAVLFITSTAGQGEFPGNAKDFYDSLSKIEDSSTRLQKIFRQSLPPLGLVFWHL